jgi:glycine/D-amino acid oxidase-like deaminating enzyme
MTYCCSSRLAVVALLSLLFPQPYVSSFSLHPTSSTAVVRVSSSALQMSSSSSSSSSSKASPSSPTSPPQHVVIAGAGVMGCTTAYYLAKAFGISSTLVDPTGTIAPAASGKAGGFLALDWNDYSPVGPLARRSFGLHQQLADELGVGDDGTSKIDYRRLTCAAISLAEGSSLSSSSSVVVNRPKGKKLEGIQWAEGDGVLGMRPLGNEDTIAQVHPKKLCEALWEETQKLAPNAKLVKGKVVEAIYDENDDKNNEYDDDDDDDENDTTHRFLRGAKLDDGSIVNGDALLYACGPWTASVMTGVKYHSIVVPTQSVLSQCVFFSGAGDPEVYVRPDQTAYCTGFPDAPVRVTELPGQEEVRPEAVAKIQDAVGQASCDLATALQEGETLNSACYLPSTPDGLPIMGALPDRPQCFMAAGHSCWGILMGPATGECMANLIATGESPHVDLTSFDPSRMGSMELVP